MKKKVSEYITKYLKKHHDHEEKVHEFATFVENFFQEMDEEFNDVRHAFYDELESFTDEIDEEMVFAIIENLKRKDGTVSGLKWTKEETETVCRQFDVKTKIESHGKHYEPLKFWLAMNYVYAVHFSVNRTTNGYIDLAIDELTNKNICFDDLVRKVFEKI